MVEADFNFPDNWTEEKKKTLSNSLTYIFNLYATFHPNNTNDKSRDKFKEYLIKEFAHIYSEGYYDGFNNCSEKTTRSTLKQIFDK